MRSTKALREELSRAQDEQAAQLAEAEEAAEVQRFEARLRNDLSLSLR